MLMKSTKFPCSYWRISAGTVYIVVFVQSDNPCFSLFVICAYCIFHLLIINIKFVSWLGLLDELIIEFRDQTIWRSMVLLLYEIWLWTLSSINYSNFFVILWISGIFVCLWHFDTQTTFPLHTPVPPRFSQSCLTMNFTHPEVQIRIGTEGGLPRFRLKKKKWQ